MVSSTQPERRKVDVGHPTERRRGRRRLSRERVLAAALEVVDHEGLSALSMRRVAAELDVEAMALYRYAPSKDALLDGLVEQLYTELHEDLAREEPVPLGQAAELPEWRAELRRGACALYRIALAHPHVVPLLATRLLAVPLARRPLAVLQAHERVLALLDRAGLDEPGVVTAYRAVTGWVLGYIFSDLRAMVENPDEPDPAFRLGLHLMPARELPRLRETAPSLTEKGGYQELTDGLDALLDGILAASAARRARAAEPADDGGPASDGERPGSAHGDTPASDDERPGSAGEQPPSADGRSAPDAV
ncbi:TetR/AcrR family transcriptional regulator [Streptomyces sp. NK15101]|uniref:TetR/AcrR family transcriptional regulator n=1 Tax=Streptomyces sp. NK15101 TaxID=2873261 RepID=UPI0027E04069|nr:TetR/AcrR family transcriptional regulator [Streptomyces sp. NK15101]